MALIGIDRDEVIEYTSALDKSEPKTVFLLGVLDNKTKIRLLSGAIDSSGNVNPSVLQEKSYEIVKAGLKGIKNLKNKKTGELEEIKKIDDAVLDRLPVTIITELAAKILEINFLTEEEEKN